MTKDLKTLLAERVQDELTPIDREQLYKEMLDETYGEVEIAGLKYSTSYVQEQLDESAFNQGVNDYIDSLDTVEINGETYYTSEVQPIEEEIEAELAEEEEESQEESE